MNTPNLDLLSAFAASEIGVERSSSITGVYKNAFSIMLYTGSTQDFQAKPSYPV